MPPSFLSHLIKHIKMSYCTAPPPTPTPSSVRVTVVTQRLLFPGV